jgi:2-furoate---CoA ligase
MQTVNEMLRRAASRAPDHCALADPARGLRLTHEELHKRVEAVAARLHADGLRPQQRVAVVAPNSADVIIAILALHRLGAVPALLNPRLKPAELAELIKRGEMAAAVLAVGQQVADAIFQSGSGARIFFLGDLVRDGEPCESYGAPVDDPQREPAQPAFIFYTSGTTGLPKAAIIPQRAAESRVLFMSTQVGLRHGRHNVVLGLMPLHHVVGFFAVLVATLALDGTYVVVEEFRPMDALQLVQQEQVTSLFATPTHLDALAAAAAQAGSGLELGSLRHVAFAGATMPDTVLETVHQHLPGEKVNIYGTTEAMNSLYMRQPKTGTEMAPGFFSEVRIVRIGGSVDEVVANGEEGELIVAASDSAFVGYLNQPQATAEKLQDGWYRTSDAAVRTPEGTIRILGRVDDMIISGGENIHPSEVERVLATAQGVAEVVVIGIPDQRWGQSVTACVVPQPGVTLSADVLDAFCRSSELADFKRPKRYFILQQLPKNALNKVLRRHLVQQVSS